MSFPRDEKNRLLGLIQNERLKGEFLAKIEQLSEEDREDLKYLTSSQSVESFLQSKFSSSGSEGNLTFLVTTTKDLNKVHEVKVFSKDTLEDLRKKIMNLDRVSPHLSFAVLMTDQLPLLGDKSNSSIPPKPFHPLPQRKNH